jgi:hypothetical protein
MGALTSPKTYAALAAFNAVDAVAGGVQVAPIRKTLDNGSALHSVGRSADDGLLALVL